MNPVPAPDFHYREATLRWLRWGNLQDLDSARHWLRQGFALEENDGQREQQRVMAVAGPDLRALWPALQQKK